MLCEVENIESYIYLVQRYSTRDKNQDKEVQRSITTGWTAFAKHRDIFKGNIGTCLNKSGDGSGPGQGTSAGYENTNGHCVSPPGNPTKGKDLEEGR